MEGIKNEILQNNMKALTLKQNEIAETLLKRYDAIEKLSAIKYIKSIFGSTAEIKDIIVAYKYAYQT